MVIDWVHLDQAEVSVWVFKVYMCCYLQARCCSHATSCGTAFSVWFDESWIRFKHTWGFHFIHFDDFIKSFLMAYLRIRVMLGYSVLWQRWRQLLFVVCSTTWSASECAFTYLVSQAFRACIERFQGMNRLISWCESIVYSYLRDETHSYTMALITFS